MAVALNAKQQRFVEEYLVDLNQTQAAIRCGYSPRTAKQQGSRLLTNADVQAAITAAQARRSERTEVEQDRVLQELARIGFASLKGLMNWDGQAVRFKPSDELTDDEAAAIAAVESETTTYTDQEGNTETKVKLKLKLWDKNTALTNLGRHLGMFKDKVEHSGEVKGGVLAVPLPLAQQDWDAMAKAQQDRLGHVAAS